MSQARGDLILLIATLLLLASIGGLLLKDTEEGMEPATVTSIPMYFNGEYLGTCDLELNPTTTNDLQCHDLEGQP
jgi:hypothetical protein